jgi:K(+)-stimulated pyrophosphate-energized sodium pump
VDLITIIPPIAGVIGLVAALVMYRAMMRYPAMEGRPSDIAELIRAGAQTFMRRELQLIAIAVAVLAVALWFALGFETTVSFLVGAVAAAAAGFIGMMAATRANVRTTTAARDKGMNSALTVAFYGGSVMGLVLASLGLLGLGACTSSSVPTTTPPSTSTASRWAPASSRCSTASAAGSSPSPPTSAPTWSARSRPGIPEDDPRNPGVIADNVGDNVGDVAGMGSDIFESTNGATIATVAIASVLLLTAGADGVDIGGSIVPGSSLMRCRSC